MSSSSPLSSSSALAHLGLPPSSVLLALESLLSEWSQVEHERHQWALEKQHFLRHIASLQQKVEERAPIESSGEIDASHEFDMKSLSSASAPSALTGEEALHGSGKGKGKKRDVYHTLPSRISTPSESKEKRTERERGRGEGRVETKPKKRGVKSQSVSSSFSSGSVGHFTLLPPSNDFNKSLSRRTSTSPPAASASASPSAAGNGSHVIHSRSPSRGSPQATLVTQDRSTGHVQGTSTSNYIAERVYHHSANTKNNKKKLSFSRPLKISQQHNISSTMVAVVENDTERSDEDHVHISYAEEKSPSPATASYTYNVGSGTVDDHFSSNVTSTPITQEVVLPSARSSYRALKPKMMLRHHVNAVRSLAFDRAPHASLILGSCSEDCTAKLWNVAQALSIASQNGPKCNIEPFCTLRGHSSAVLSISIHSALGLCATSGLDGWVHCWELPTLDSDPNAALGRYDPWRRDGVHHSGPVWCTLINANTRLDTPLLHCGCADGNVYTYDAQLHSMAPKHKITAPRQGASVSALALNSDESLLIVGYSTGQLAFVDPGQGIILSVHRDLDADENALYITALSAAMTPDRSFAAHADHTIRLFERQAVHSIATIRAHGDCVTSLSLDSDSGVLASSSHDETIRFWDVRAGQSYKILQTLEAYQTHRSKWDEAIHCVAWAPKANAGLPSAMIVSAGADGCIKLYA